MIWFSCYLCMWPAWCLQQELLDLYTLNLHRIDKDVQRCDRNYWYFTPANLEKLRNVMCRLGAYIYSAVKFKFICNHKAKQEFQIQSILSLVMDSVLLIYWNNWRSHYIYSYIWKHLEIGYVQGMCDLLAPLLVILDDGECVWYLKCLFLGGGARVL